MDEGHLRRKIQRNITWYFKLAEELTEDKSINNEGFATLVNLIQKESHFLLNNELANEKHQELITTIKIR